MTSTSVPIQSQKLVKLHSAKKISKEARGRIRVHPAKERNLSVQSPAGLRGKTGFAAIDKNCQGMVQEHLVTVEPVRLISILTTKQLYLEIGFVFSTYRVLKLLN